MVRPSDGAVAAEGGRKGPSSISTTAVHDGIHVHGCPETGHDHRGKEGETGNVVKDLTVLSCAVKIRFRIPLETQFPTLNLTFHTSYSSNN